MKESVWVNGKGVSWLLAAGFTFWGLAVIATPAGNNLGTPVQASGQTQHALDHMGLVDVGNGRHHLQLVRNGRRELLLFLSGADPSIPAETAAESIIAYISGAPDSESVQIQFEPSPTAGDSPGQTSQWIAQLPDTFVQPSLHLIAPTLVVDRERYRVTVHLAAGSAPNHSTNAGSHAEDAAMPEKVKMDAEMELYLTPGGAYTEADIAANGHITASQKFVGFRADHDTSPKSGDRICPITDTKANPECAWIIGGQEYLFCCPPCVDEFVAKAKADPGSVKPPSAYIQN